MEKINNFQEEVEKRIAKDYPTIRPPLVARFLELLQGETQLDCPKLTTLDNLLYVVKAGSPEGTEEEIKSCLHDAVYGAYHYSQLRKHSHVYHGTCNIFVISALQNL